MDGSIGRLREVALPPTPLRPARTNRDAPEKDHSFEEALDDSPKNPDTTSESAEREPQGDRSISPQGDDDVGSRIDLTA